MVIQVVLVFNTVVLFWPIRVYLIVNVMSLHILALEFLVHLLYALLHHHGNLLLSPFNLL